MPTLEVEPVAGIGSDYLGEADMAVDLTKRRVPAEYVTRSTVLGRGWTQAAIGRFLTEPDGTMANMRYRGSPPVRLYAMARVQAIEGTREWQEWFHASRRRRAAALERAAAGGVGTDGGATGGGGAPVVVGAGAGAEAEAGVEVGVRVGSHVGGGRDAGAGRGRGSNREVA
ncbi:hypothetical protein [Embleya hyalina]|uniref:Uncharacterized protein n=1 Tax=Embleya hyalina TaxID=516124 RepID=A0A401Z4G8_9ACTN|nr:hypothetical protein [Embleya hyalina]GCE01749.1 hypothetical protein EHYA_09523 [Embleya hyalina]